MNSKVNDYLKIIEEEKEISEQLVPFDEVIVDSSEGMPKGFAMLKGSSIIELYDILKNDPNTHYQFCGRDYTLNSTREEFENMRFSAVVKVSKKSTEFSRSELVGSRIAELFGVDCPYVVPLGKNNRIVASLDFLRYSQEMETFAEYTSSLLNRQASMARWVKAFTRALDKDKNYANITAEQRTYLIKEIIRHYIVRKFIIKDNDFNCGNMAIVMGINSIPKLISFDFEFCLNNSLVFDHSDELGVEFMKKNIEEIIREYPNEFKEVMSELQMTSKRYERIIAILEEFLEDKASAKNWANSMNTIIYKLNYFQQEFSLTNSM